MKKRSLAAIMMASTMMLALMGCGNSTTESAPASETTGETATESSVNTETEDTATEIDASADTSGVPEEFITKADPSFEYKGKTLSFTDDAKTVVEGIKSVAKTVDEVPDEGDDGKSFDFDKDADGLGLSIATSVKEGKETIDLMAVTCSEFKTSKGISVGSKMEDVKAAYGDPYEIDKFDDGELEIFTCEGFKMSFDIEKGVVESIVYSDPDFRG